MLIFIGNGDYMSAGKVVATQEFREFISAVNGMQSKLARGADVSARTVARIRSGANTNSGTARRIYRAAKKTGFDFEGTFDDAFSTTE